jgi:hypothetical protein
MHKSCQKSCGTCFLEEKKSKEPPKLLLTEEKQRELDTAVLEQTEDFGDRQKADGDDARLTMDLIASSIEYMQSDQVTALPGAIRENCRNKNGLCTFWAFIGT